MNSAHNNANIDNKQYVAEKNGNANIKGSKPHAAALSKMAAGNNKILWLLRIMQKSREIIAP